ncbi:P-loop NTPase fold protein [Neptuniibacter sp.]|uniref:P-loop NTPase fold protein n=1 Tax=Neptuniibacter sp. TaxID=1962643 RepID=UPI003B596A51
MTPEQIKESFKDYLNTEDRYAVILSGDWGSGKTHFWDTELDPIARRKSMRILRVSLFGVDTHAQLESSICNAVLLSSKSSNAIFKYGGKAFESVLNAASDSKAASGLSSMVSSLANEQAIRSLNSNTVIMLDDFERSKMEARDVLGTINRYVEQRGSKVILIADEEQITDTEYLNYREKVIRYRWQLKKTDEEIYQILKDNVGLHLTALFNESESNVKGFITLLKHSNLRTWLSVVRQVEEVLKKAGNAVSDKSLQLNIFFYAAGLRYLMTCQPLVTVKEISGWSSHGITTKLPQKEKEATTAEQDEEAKYDSARRELNQQIITITRSYPVIPMSAVFEYIHNGAWVESMLENDLVLWQESQTSEVTDFIDNWSCMEDQEFEEKFQKIQNLLSLGEIKSSVEFSKLVKVDDLIRSKIGLEMMKGEFLPAWRVAIAIVDKKGGFTKINNAFPDPVVFVSDGLENVSKVFELIVDQYEKSSLQEDLIVARRLWLESDTRSWNHSNTDYTSVLEKIAFLQPENLEVLKERIKNSGNRELGDLVRALHSVVTSAQRENLEIVRSALSDLIKFCKDRSSKLGLVSQYWNNAMLENCQNQFDQVNQQIAIQQKREAISETGE